MERAFFDRSHEICEELAELMTSLEFTMESGVKEWLSSCVVDSKLSVSAGRIFLTKKEKEAFLLEAKAYEKAVKEKAFLSEWHQELIEILEKKNITKMEAVRVHIAHGVHVFYGKELELIEGFLSELYVFVYEKVCELLRKNGGAKTGISVEEVLQKAWTPDEKNFYVRLEVQKKSLLVDLEKAIIRACAVGSGVQESIDVFVGSMQKFLKTVKNRVAGLILTEQSYFFNSAIHEAMVIGGVTSYEIVSMEEAGRSKICGEMHGKVMGVEAFLVGASAPPFHVRCRSVVVPLG